MEVISHKFIDSRVTIEFKHQGRYGSVSFYPNIEVESESFSFETSLTGFNTSGGAFAGLNETIEGNTINVVDTTPFGRKINPTRVFWLIYKVSKRILCPECM